MLTIVIPASEGYNNATNEFLTINETKLTLEHSLVSLAKWESKWEKPFLSQEKKTLPEMVDYIRCMTITQNVDPNVYSFLTRKNLDEVSAYIEKPMTATKFYNAKGMKSSKPRSKREVVTAEYIYYWMFSFNIPVECQKWHLNRLLALIRLCNIKNSPQKKMTKNEILQSNSDLNALRRKQLGTKG